jgi:hypothetical protein
MGKTYIYIYIYIYREYCSVLSIFELFLMFVIVVSTLIIIIKNYFLITINIEILFTNIKKKSNLNCWKEAAIFYICIFYIFVDDINLYLLTVFILSLILPEGG